MSRQNHPARNQSSTGATHLNDAIVSHPLPIQSYVRLPLLTFETGVAAGFASPADDYSEGSLDLNDLLVQQGHAEATFILRVSGWSMVGAGIHDGDRVVVDRALTPAEGDVVVAAINGDLTIKRLTFENGLPVLSPENADFQPIRFAEGDELVIWGVVTSCLRMFRKG